MDTFHTDVNYEQDRVAIPRIDSSQFHQAL